MSYEPARGHINDAQREEKDAATDLELALEEVVVEIPPPPLVVEVILGPCQSNRGEVAGGARADRYFPTKLHASGMRKLSGEDHRRRTAAGSNLAMRARNTPCHSRPMWHKPVTARTCA